MTVSDLLNADEKEILTIDGFGEKTLEDAFNLVASYIEASKEEDVEEEVNVEQLLDDLKEQETAVENSAEETETESLEENMSETTDDETPTKEGELALEEKSK